MHTVYAFNHKFQQFLEENRAVTTLESRRPMWNTRWLCKQAHKGGLGACPPRKNLKFRVAEMPLHLCTDKNPVKMIISLSKK